MTTVVTELGCALRAHRVQLGLSQEEVCRSAGVARSWLSKVEAGRHGGAELQKVLDLAATLGLTLVLTREGGAPTESGPTDPRPTDPGPTEGVSPRPVSKPARPGQASTARPEPPATAQPVPARPSRITEGDPFEHLFG